MSLTKHEKLFFALEPEVKSIGLSDKYSKPPAEHTLSQVRHFTIGNMRVNVLDLS